MYTKMAVTDTKTVTQITKGGLKNDKKVYRLCFKSCSCSFINVRHVCKRRRGSGDAVKRQHLLHQKQKQRSLPDCDKRLRIRRGECMPVHGYGLARSALDTGAKLKRHLPSAARNGYDGRHFAGCCERQHRQRHQYTNMVKQRLFRTKLWNNTVQRRWICYFDRGDKSRKLS